MPPRATLRPTTSSRPRPFITTKIRSTMPPANTPTKVTTMITTTKAATIVPPNGKIPPITSEHMATVKETGSKKSNVNVQSTASSSSILNDHSRDHPQDNEIAGSGADHVQAGTGTGVPEPSGPLQVDTFNQSTSAHQAKLNLGAVIALGVFGGFVFLAAVITTVVILIRR